VKRYSRPDNDLTYHFPLIVETLASLPHVVFSVSLIAKASVATDRPFFTTRPITLERVLVWADLKSTVRDGHHSGDSHGLACCWP
jgi:hypothetical protein